MAKVEVGTLINASGSESTVHPSNGKKFSLTDLQTLVRGDIEIVPMRPGNGHAIMYCNEEGKYKPDFQPNPRATALANIQPDDYLVGPILIVRKEVAQ